MQRAHGPRANEGRSRDTCYDASAGGGGEEEKSGRRDNARVLPVSREQYS